MSCEKFQHIFSEILKMSNDGFIVVDTDGVVIDISECYSDFLGRPRSWIVGRDIRETIPNSKMLEVVKYGYEDELALHKYVPGYTRDENDVLCWCAEPVSVIPMGRSLPASLRFIFASKWCRTPSE